MNAQMECMCLECGISLFISVDLLILEAPSGNGMDLVREPFCAECGGKLLVIGKAGDEPSYRVEE